MEKSQVHFGRTVIAYTVERGRRQKTVAIRVDAVNGVRVRAPESTPIAKLDEIVHRKAPGSSNEHAITRTAPRLPRAREFKTRRYLGPAVRL